jgi:hypothetical protein
MVLVQSDQWLHGSLEMKQGILVTVAFKVKFVKIKESCLQWLVIGIIVMFFIQGEIL